MYPKSSRDLPPGTWERVLADVRRKAEDPKDTRTADEIVESVFKRHGVVVLPSRSVDELAELGDHHLKEEIERDEWNPKPRVVEF